MSELKPDRSEVKFDEAAVKNASKMPELPHGWHVFVTVESNTTVAEKEKTRGNLVIQNRHAALKDPEDPGSKARPFMRDQFTVPVDNPRVPGHKAPDWSFGMSARFLRAVYDDKELLKPPRSDGNGGYTYKGKKIEQADMDSAREEALAAAVELATDLYFDGPTDLIDRTFYGKVGKDKTGQWTNILEYRSIEQGLPDGEELVSWDDDAPKASSRRRPSKKKTKKKGKRK